MRFLNVRAAALAAGFTIAVAAAAHAAGGGGSGVSATPFGTPTPKIPNPSRTITAVRGDRMWDWTQQTRSEVLARHGMVATSHRWPPRRGFRSCATAGTQPTPPSPRLRCSG